jgi:hypothetical protein
MRRWIFLAALLIGTGAFYVAVVRAGEPKKPHLQYRPTYEEALIEGRLRNLPVMVSRQKDD